MVFAGFLMFLIFGMVAQAAEWSTLVTRTAAWKDQSNGLSLVAAVAHSGQKKRTRHEVF